MLPTNSDLIAKLKRLKGDANTCLKEIVAKDKSFNANYGDLRCVETQFCICDDGDQHYAATIEESGDTRLAFSVTRALAMKGWEDVYVTTEW